MTTYQEGMIAIFICLTVLNLSIVGGVVYYISRIREENRVERFKVQVLIDSMIEIFESKYKFYEDDDKGGISPGG